MMMLKMRRANGGCYYSITPVAVAVLLALLNIEGRASGFCGNPCPSMMVSRRRRRQPAVQTLAPLLALLQQRRIKSINLIHQLSAATDDKQSGGAMNTQNVLSRGIVDLERQVVASTQAKLDVKRIVDALDGDDDIAPPPPQTAGMTNDSTSSSYLDDVVRPDEPIPSSSWKVGLAAASAVSILSYFFVLHNSYIAIILAIATFLAASADPLNDDDDDVISPISRIIGRATLKSVKASQPKAKAIARVMVTGEEDVKRLKTRVLELEDENAALRLWQQQRLKVDATISKYTLDELKQRARESHLPVGGTKSQLLMRLIEAGVIE